MSETRNTMQTLIVNNEEFWIQDAGAVRADAPQSLTEEEKAQARQNIGVGEAQAVTDEKYFLIDDDGLLSLREEYRGLGHTSYPHSASDNGVGTVGSKNAELPESLVIPDVVNEIAVTSLVEGMFCGNTRIKSLTIPHGVTEIPKGFCRNAYNLAELNGTENVTKINSVAFQFCGIQKALFPNLAEFSGQGHFNACTNLVIVDIGNTITSLPPYCLQSCEKLSSIRGGSKITTLSNNSLFYTKRLRNIPFAEQLTSIGTNGLFYSRVNYDWSTQTNCTYDENAVYTQWNTTDFWSGCTFTPCKTELKSTFHQRNPIWYSDATEGEVSYPKNCQCCAGAMLYSIFENKEMVSPVAFIEAVKAVDPSLMNKHPGVGSANMVEWFQALGYDAEALKGGWNAGNLQKVYDALAAGHLVIGGTIAVGTPVVSHAVLFHGITENGEIMVADSESYSASIKDYRASTYSMGIQHMSVFGGGEPIVVKKKA